MEKLLEFTKFTNIKKLKETNDLTTTINAIAPGKITLKLLLDFFDKVEKDLPEGFKKSKPIIEPTESQINPGLQIINVYQKDSITMRIRLVLSVDKYNQEVSIMVYISITDSKNKMNRLAFEFGIMEKLKNVSPQKLYDKLVINYQKELADTGFEL